VCFAQHLTGCEQYVKDTQNESNSQPRSEALAVNSVVNSMSKIHKMKAIHNPILQAARIPEL